MNINLTEDKSKTYILACSFGPDSMFLLNVLLENGYNFIVCHVNYHKRPESNSEEENLRKYCDEHNLKLEVLDTTGLKVKGNFQTWARNIRYEFFEKIYIKNNASGLFVAHHLDDVLETYLIQKRRGGYVSRYGIAYESKHKSMRVLRPLLNITKKEIVEYDDNHKIPYSIDSSNLQDSYERNKYRNHYLKSLSDEEKALLVKEIEAKNYELDALISKAKYVLNNREFIPVKEAKQLNKDEFAFVIFGLMETQGIYAPISSKQVDTLRKNLDSNKANIQVKLGSDISYYQEYFEIRILKNRKPYSYTIEKPTYFECDDFAIDLSNGGDDRNIHDDDYPITIRTAKNGDKYLVKGYYSKVNRLFIDWKMPLHLRAIWPIVVNKDDKIIYIPRYRRNFIDNHKTKFKISLK